MLPFCEDESVQLFRVAFFGRDLLQNPYFNKIWNIPKGLGQNAAEF